MYQQYLYVSCCCFIIIKDLNLFRTNLLIQEGRGFVSSDLSVRVIFPCQLCTYSLDVRFAPCSVSKMIGSCHLWRLVGFSFYSMRSVQRNEGLQKLFDDSQSGIVSYRSCYMFFYSRSAHGCTFGCSGCYRRQKGGKVVGHDCARVEGGCKARPGMHMGL